MVATHIYRPAGRVLGPTPLALWTLRTFWTRRHLLEMTRAYVLYFPAAAPTTTTTAPIFPN